MDRKSVAILASVAAIGGVGITFYESQLLELRSELEEARLREAHARATLAATTAHRPAAPEPEAAKATAPASTAIAQATPRGPATQVRPKAEASGASAPGDAQGESRRRAAAEAQTRAAEEQRRAAEEAARAAQRDAEQRDAEQAPRFYREPYRPERSAAAERLSEQVARAQALEHEGKGAEAVTMYIQAARRGSGPAARRLYEIYLRGITGVMPNHAEALKWNNAARVLGEDVSRPPDPLRAEQEARRAAEAARREAEKAAGVLSHQALYQQGQALEKEGRTADAVRVYVRAARAGSIDAERRLGEIVDEGKAPRNLPHPDLAPTVPRAQAQPRFFGEPYRPDDPAPGFEKRR